MSGTYVTLTMGNSCFLPWSAVRCREAGHLPGRTSQDRTLMHTRLSRICDAVIEAGWLAALVVTPRCSSTPTPTGCLSLTNCNLLRSIALVMAVAWVTQLLDLWLSGGDRQPATGAARAPGLWDTHPQHAARPSGPDPVCAVSRSAPSSPLVPRNQPRRIIRTPPGDIHLP